MLALCYIEDDDKYGFYLSKNIWQVKDNKIAKSRDFNKKIFLEKSINIKIGDYGIFKIKSNYKNIAQATCRGELQIIEICKLENINNLNDLYFLLINGVTEENGLKHLSFGQKIFFTSENLLDEDNNYLGFLCDVSDIDYFDSKFFLKKSINHLLKYSLLKSNIIMIKNDFYGNLLIYKEIYDLTKDNTKKEFYSIEKSNNDDKIDEKNIEVWQEKQLEFFDRKQDVLLKNQKEFRDILISNDKDIMERILNDRLVDLQNSIENKIGKEELEKLLKNQLEKKILSIQKVIENKIDKEELDSLSSKLDNVENDCRTSIQEDLKIFSEKISDFALKVEKHEKDNKGYFDLLSDLEQKVNILESNIKNLDNLENDCRASIQEDLNSFFEKIFDFALKVEKQEKDNKEYFDLLSDLEQKVNILESNIKNEENFSSYLIHFDDFEKKYKLKEKENINNYKDLIEKIKDNLSNINFSDNFIDIFACLLFIIYKKNIPLFLLGPNGENIADIFSITIFGKPAVRLECIGDYSLNVKKEITRLNDRVVIIKNPFHWINYIPDILQSFEDKYFFVLYPFIEDVVIEPQSLYNYMIPCFTENCFDSVRFFKLTEFNVCSYNFEDSLKIKKCSDFDDVFDEFKFKKIYKNNLKYIFGGLRQIKEDFDNDDLEHLLIFSYLFLTSQVKLFFDNIDKYNVSDDMKNYFETFKIEEEE